MSDDRPIGVLSCGVTGLVVVRAIADVLPAESIHYLGDTANYPYWPRMRADIARLASRSAKELERRDPKLVVIGCSTITAAALDALRALLTVPVVGIIERAVGKANRLTRGQRIGLLSAALTADSGSYEETLRRSTGGKGTTLVGQACPELVELVDRGITTGPEVEKLVARCVEQLRTARVDTVILGCTHLHLLRGAIGEALGRDTFLVSPATEVAADVYEILGLENMFAGRVTRPDHLIEFTADPEPYSSLIQLLRPPRLDGPTQLRL